MCSFLSWSARRFSLHMSCARVRAHDCTAGTLVHWAECIVPAAIPISVQCAMGHVGGIVCATCAVACCAAQVHKADLCKLCVHKLPAGTTSSSLEATAASVKASLAAACRQAGAASEAAAVESAAVEQPGDTSKQLLFLVFQHAGLANEVFAALPGVCMCASLATFRHFFACTLHVDTQTAHTLSSCFDPANTAWGAARVVRQACTHCGSGIHPVHCCCFCCRFSVHGQCGAAQQAAGVARQLTQGRPQPGEAARWCSRRSHASV